MIEIADGTPGPTLIAFVRQWLRLMAAGRCQEACDMIDVPNCYGITWTPQRIRLTVEEAFGTGSRFRSQHPEGIRWSNPDDLVEERQPDVWPHGHDGYRLDHEVPLNGEWSDLTAQFEFQKTQ